ncbi:MAG: homoaconitase [bacterium]|nr:homoaconitase [bacterium]
MAQNIIEKIAQAHMVDGPTGRPVRTGDFLSIRPKHIMTHDNTAAVMNKFKGMGVKRMEDPKIPVYILDHDIQNKSESNLTKYLNIENFAKEQGVDFYPAGSGIGHQVMVEQQYVTPGSLVVGSDSHSNMYGAMGALGTPVVRTDAAVIWATGTFWWQVPRTIEVALEGALPKGSTGKDVIVTLCGIYNQGEVLNAAVEFTGPGVASLSMDERLSISNMTTEWGALVGWFPVDEVTLAYIEKRRQKLAGSGINRVSETDIQGWRTNPPAPDADAVYAGRVTLDLATVTPHVSGPDSVQVCTSLAQLEKQRIKVNRAYLVSCVNSRYEDLSAAARTLEGKKIADTVKFYIAAASKEIQETAEASGVWQTLLDSGAQALPPGCGPCIGLGTGTLEPGEVGISATNRNFKGRMGSRDAKCYLASPAVVAASAISGYIRGPESHDAGNIKKQFTSLEPPAAGSEAVSILDGFPAKVEERLVFLPQDNLNTDGIYGKDYTYREDMTPEQMAEVVMENYDPGFAAAAASGDVVVGGANFGTGSSREQAVTALQAKGIRMVIAGSFSQTYLRNAFNNGFLCIQCPRLVESLQKSFAAEIGKESKTIIPGTTIAVDFVSGTISYESEVFNFPPLGQVPQELVVAGGVENLVKSKLGNG